MNSIKKLLWRIRFAVPARETALIRDRIETAIKCGAERCPHGVLWRRFSGKCPYHFLEGNCTDCSEGEWFAARKTNTRKQRAEHRKRFLNRATPIDPSTGQVSLRTNPAVPFRHSNGMKRPQKRKLWLAGLSGETTSLFGLIRLAFVFSRVSQGLRNPENTERQNRPAGFLQVLGLTFFATIPFLPEIISPLFFPGDRKVFLIPYQLLFPWLLLPLQISIGLVTYTLLQGEFFFNLFSLKGRAG
ncbi:MAG: hypothetical protein LBO80_12035 [Treponema sp.]|jgi:hypothetical protein|nr:hypothetical protein [Treponema sp.]